VTCALGVHMVGYVMVVLSASSAMAAFINGKVQKYIGRCPLIIFGQFPTVLYMSECFIY